MNADALLGAMLLSGSRAVGMLARELTPADFPDETSARVFEAMRSLADQCLPTDPLSVFERLNCLGRPWEVAGVLEAVLRPRGELQRAREALESALAKLPPLESEAAVVSAQELLASTAYCKKIPSGIAWIDQALDGGLSRGEITVVAQRPWLLSEAILETVVSALAASGNALLIYTRRPREAVLQGVIARYACAEGHPAHEDSPRHRIARAFIGALNLPVEDPSSTLCHQALTLPALDVVLVEGVRGPFELLAGDLGKTARTRDVAVLLLAPLKSTPEWTRCEECDDWMPRITELPQSVRALAATVVLALRPWLYRRSDQDGRESPAMSHAEVGALNELRLHVHRRTGGEHGPRE